MVQIDFPTSIIALYDIDVYGDYGAGKPYIGTVYLTFGDNTITEWKNVEFVDADEDELYGFVAEKFGKLFELIEDNNV